MSDAIIVAIITVAGAIAAQLIISRQSAKDLYSALDKHQAITDAKIDELTREVREHNQFARRMPVLEEQMKVANHRIADLENKGG